MNEGTGNALTEKAIAWNILELTTGLGAASLLACLSCSSSLEERDLTSDFGDAYREYQRDVPMLLPTRLPKTKT